MNILWIKNEKSNWTSLPWTRAACCHAYHFPFPARMDTRLLASLIERRLKARPAAEQERSQKIIQGLAAIFFILLFIVSSIDHPLGWSTVPTFVALLGDILVAVALYIVFLVFRENTFTSATIEVTDEQKVISTGPYAVTRHPMYSGAFIMLLGIPLALGSWWAFILSFSSLQSLSGGFWRKRNFLQKIYLGIKVTVRGSVTV